jgi:putative MATE family efflux protein
MRFSTKTKSYFTLLKQALSGTEQVYTTGSIDKAIFLLSVPMVLEMVMESLFAVVDIFFVSKVSVNATATVGLTESVLTLVYSIAIGLSMAVTAMVARRVGEKQYKRASITAVQAIYLALGISFLISLIGLWFAEDILHLMGGSETLIQEGAGYTKWMLGGNMSIMMLFLINAIFRGAGDASLAMRSLWLANILNIILDPIFIFGWGPIPAFGVEGAAIATTIGRSCGVVYQVYHLLKGKGLIKLIGIPLNPIPKIIKKMLQISAGGTGQFLIASASWVFLVRIVSVFGSDALAGYTIGIRVIIFAILPAWGMANAAATLVGQNLGALQPERAEQSVWRTAFFNLIFLALVTVFFLTTAQHLIGIFTADANVLFYGMRCLQIVSLGYIFYAYGMVMTQSFNGAGDTRTPTILNFFGFWMFQIPLAYLLAITFELGPNGVFWAIPIAESAIALVAIIIFKRGKWKSVKV